jgi:hypothetical protein
MDSHDRTGDKRTAPPAAADERLVELDVPRLTFSDRERPADIGDHRAQPVNAENRGEQAISGARSVAASDARPLDLLAPRIRITAGCRT